MRRNLLLLSLLFVVAFMSGCVSPERLFNLTPLGSNVDRNTVNLWPLYYGNDKGASIVWPFFDKDDKGFALRPLVFNEDKEWGVLWPVIDFDQNYFRLLNIVIFNDKGGIIPLFWIEPHDSWQILLAYKTNESWGIFPLFHKHGDFSYLFPLYCRIAGKFLLTPVSYFSSGFNCFTLAWWNRANGHWGIFPICYVGREGHHFLLWWKTQNSAGLFPFYINIKDFTAIGPAWWDEDAWGLFPICRFGEESSYFLTWWKTPKTNGLFPLYFKFHSLAAAGPVWWDKNSWGLFPLFSYKSDSRSRKASLLYHILGGCEWGRSEDDTRTSANTPRSHSIDWLCYLGKYAVSPYDNNSVCHSFRMWPFFNYVSTSPSAPASGTVGSLKHNALLGTLWNYRSKPSSAWIGEDAYKCYELSNLVREAHDVVKQSAQATDDQIAKRQEECHQAINETCRKLDLAPIDQLTHENLDALANNLELKYPRQHIQDRRFGMLLNTVDYEEHSARSSFRVLWGALFKRKATPVKTETSVLWRGYRHVSTPSRSIREIFPFISCYSNQKEHTTITSFAWRLYRRETSPSGNKLWLFYIPFQ